MILINTSSQPQAAPISYEGSYTASLHNFYTDVGSFLSQLSTLRENNPNPTADDLKKLPIFAQLEKDIDNIGQLTTEMLNSTNPNDLEIVKNNASFQKFVNFFQCYPSDVPNHYVISLQSIADQDNGVNASDWLANYLMDYCIPYLDGPYTQNAFLNFALNMTSNYLSSIAN